MNKDNWPTLDRGIKGNEGFLVDTQIATALARGQLVTNGRDASSKYACYELSIGDDIHQMILDDDPGPESDLYKVKNTGPDGVFYVNPGDTFKIYASESLDIPADVFAIAIPVGNMYKLGLSPETTFADPGFKGPFYITVCNYSRRVVRLKVGDPLARIFFYVTSTRPNRIHDSHPRELPPSVQRPKRPSEQELLAQPQDALMREVMNFTDPPHYQHAFVTNNILTNYLKTQLEDAKRSSAVSVLLSALSLLLAVMPVTIIAISYFKSTWPTIFEGAIGSLIASAIVGALALCVNAFRRSIWSSIKIVLGWRQL